jgi:hypothetical protein
MAVVSTKSTLFKSASDPLGAEPKPELARGRPIIVNGSITNAADDSSASKYLLAELPSDCILLPQTFFDVEDWGFAGIRVGTFDDNDALITQTKATENIIDPITEGDAFHAMPLWQVLGISADPGGVIGIYAHSVAGATGAGSMKFQIWYAYR